MLLVALVAMLLVATGGSARASQARSTAGTGHVGVAQHHGRQAAAVPPASHDHSHLHLDLGATPPGEHDAISPRVDEQPVAADVSQVAGTAVVAVGRAPPAP